jgi:hypothetical protein
MEDLNSVVAFTTVPRGGRTGLDPLFCSLRCLHEAHPRERGSRDVTKVEVLRMIEEWGLKTPPSCVHCGREIKLPR